MTPQKLEKFQCLTSGWLAVCLGIGLFTAGAQPVLAEATAENLTQPSESNPQTPPSDQTSPSELKVVLVDPALYNPMLPEIGDAASYLPDPSEAIQLRLVVRLSKRRVFIYRGRQAIASYPIAVGKPGWETPVGDYRVLNMEKNPIFKSFKSGAIIYPGADNPLGIRWIGIWTDGKTQLGFHGTNQPELIGQAVSHGCIRMHNKDVVALFNQVAIGTPVKVEP